MLTFLATTPEPCSVLSVCTYMRQMHRVDKGATRECLHRLAKAGLIRHVGFGMYQRIDQGSAGAD